MKRTEAEPKKAPSGQIIGAPQKNVGNFDLIFLMGFPCLGFSKIFVGCQKKIEVLEGSDTSGGKIPSNDLATDIAGVGYKTGPTTPSQIDGFRLSETKRAH